MLSMRAYAKCISCILAIYLLGFFVNDQFIVLLPRRGCSWEGGLPGCHRPALGLLLMLHYALQVSQCGLRVFARLANVAEAGLLERVVRGRRRSLRGDWAGVRGRLTNVLEREAWDRGGLETDSLRRVWFAQEIGSGRSWVATQGAEGQRWRNDRVTVTWAVAAIHSGLRLLLLKVCFLLYCGVPVGLACSLL